MPHLFTWRGETPWKIYGPPAGESGKWRCTCPTGRERDRPRRYTEARAPLCRHLSELLNVANQGALSGRFDATPAGDEKADSGCECNGGRPLVRQEHKKPPPHGPLPGQPSRNRPCPCGSGELYKRCHGRDGHPGLPVEPEAIEPPVPPPGPKKRAPRKTSAERRIEERERREAIRRRVGAMYKEGKEPKR